MAAARVSARAAARLVRLDAMASDLLDAWRMSNEVNLYLLGKIPPGALGDAYGSRTRSVAAQFAHIHAVRLRWLEHASPTHARGLAKLPKEPTKAQLKAGLQKSAKAIERFLEDSEASGKVKSWKGGPTTFLGYLVAHEAHHRALAMVAMRVAGRKLGDEVVYGLWDWGKRSSRR